MDKQTNNLTPAQTAARRENSRQSTGPRTCRGKRRSSRNALKHGIYSDVHYFYWEAARDLGEDPNDFTQLFQGLLEARRPADVLEHVLVEDIAVLIWKKARLERAESAVQVCNVRRHDLERYRQCIQVGRDVTSVSQSEVFEKGLRVGLDAPGKYESVLQMLGMLEEMTERNEFNPTMHRLLRAMYGDKPTMRGAGLLNRFLKLRQMREKGQNVGEAKQVFEFMLSDEHRDVLEEYELFLREHVENTRSARIAAMAPSHAQWAAIIRQQNALHRQLERKIRLLDEIQERRRRNRGSAEELLSKLMPPGFRSGGDPAPTTPEGPVGASPGAPPAESASDETAGMAPASQGSELGCVPQSEQCEEEGVADMPQCGTPAPPDETGISARPLGGEEPQGEGEATPTPEAPEGASHGVPLPESENIENRGNEAKNSLKTNEVTPPNCANQTHSCLQNVPIEAKKSRISGARRAVVRASRACMPRPCRHRLRPHRSFRQWPAVTTRLTSLGKARKLSR